jgi:hypothetical protein
MAQSKLAEFNKISLQLEGLHEEIDKLSKKKPDAAINDFKLSFINELIAKANLILDSEYLPFNEFKSFDKEKLPSNSDVVFIISQYIKAFNREYSDKKMWLSDITHEQGIEELLRKENED